MRDTRLRAVRVRRDLLSDARVYALLGVHGVGGFGRQGCVWVVVSPRVRGAHQVAVVTLAALAALVGVTGPVGVRGLVGLVLSFLVGLVG